MSYIHVSMEKDFSVVNATAEYRCTVGPILAFQAVQKDCAKKQVVLCRGLGLSGTLH